MCTNGHAFDPDTPCDPSCVTGSRSHLGRIWREHPLIDEVHADTLRLVRHRLAVLVRSASAIARLRAIRDLQASANDPANSTTIADVLPIAAATLRTCRTEIDNFALAIDKAVATLDLAIALAARSAR